MTTIRTDDLIFLAKLRTLVGFLGEKDQLSWWPSSFYSSSSNAFLTPIFGKTSVLTQYYGVREAAMRVHDEHIGVGKGVFHLFRLPEVIEKELHNLLSDQGFSEEVAIDISNEDTAKSALGSLCGKDISPSVGPVRIGGVSDLEKKNIWQAAARYYNLSFKDNTKVYPYFTDNT